jgi:hypothetical protein
MTYKMVNSTQAAITAERTSVSLDFLRLMALRRPLIAGKRDPTCDQGQHVTATPIILMPAYANPDSNPTDLYKLVCDIFKQPPLLEEAISYTLCLRKNALHLHGQPW